MSPVFTALLLLVGLVPATLHAAPVPAYAPTDAPTELARSYFGARYYASRSGRFTSVDPIVNAGLALANPQRWNRYAYSLNNPTRYTDPDGRDPVTLTVLGIVVAPEVAALTATAATVTAAWMWHKREAISNSIVGAGQALGEAVVWAKEKISPDGEKSAENSVAKEVTPATDKDQFEPVRGTPAKRHKETGEIWKKDQLHKDEYEVYKNKKDFEQGKRDRSVWEDGRIKKQF